MIGYEQMQYALVDRQGKKKKMRDTEEQEENEENNKRLLACILNSIRSPLSHCRRWCFQHLYQYRPAIDRPQDMTDCLS